MDGPSPSSVGSVLERLTTSLGKLPGIGAKSAERLAHHLLNCPAPEAIALAEAIHHARQQIRHCPVCFNLAQADDDLCAICRDSRRDPAIVCVVEQHRDLLSIERAGAFRGLYHVLLGRLAPLQGMGPDQLTVEALVDRVGNGSIREVILATNPNLEGDSTALLVAKRLAEFDSLTITRLARGVASGSPLEFANKEMLADAVTGRQRF